MASHIEAHAVILPRTCRRAFAHQKANRTLHRVEQADRLKQLQAWTAKPTNAGH